MPGSFDWYLDLEREARALGVWGDIEGWLGGRDLFYLLTVILRRPDMLKPWLFDRCREVQMSPNSHLDLWAREHGKALGLDTPILTPIGWRKHGELKVGDEVYGSDGRPTTVIAVSEVYNDPAVKPEYIHTDLGGGLGRLDVDPNCAFARNRVDCVEITFPGCAPIMASSNHMWPVRRRDLINSHDLLRRFLSVEWYKPAKTKNPIWHKRRMETTRDLVNDTRLTRFRFARPLNGRTGSCASAPSNVSMLRSASPQVSCIQVSNEDGIYLVGRTLLATHNSSIITFALTIQDIINDPEITVGIFSHTRGIAKTFLRQIKTEFEANQRLHQLYPGVFYALPAKESPKWSEDDGIVVKRIGNPKESTVEAWGLVDGQPTGRHFRLRVYDDVVTRESVATAEQIEKTTKAWELSDNLGVTEEAGGAARYIGTRYSLYDTYASIMARKAATPRIYPATHNGRFDGKPVLFSEKVWQDKLQRQGRSTVAAQLLQNPMADEAASFRMEWLRAYEVRPRTLNVYIMGDPSRGRSATSDNTAIAVVGIAAGGTKYLLDGICHQCTLSQRWQALRGLYHRWSAMPGVQRVSVGWERFGAQSDDEYFQEQMELEHRRKIENAFFQIEELAWPREGGASKRERIERLEPDFRNGRFFLPLSVLHEGKPAVWKVDTDPASRGFGVVEYQAGTGLTRQQMQAIEGGSQDLVCKPIIVRDPLAPGVRAGGGRYDLTVKVIEDYAIFPFGRHDDLLDALSRIYDMEPVPPMAPSARRGVDPRVFVDGV